MIVKNSLRFRKVLISREQKVRYFGTRKCNYILYFILVDTLKHIQDLFNVHTPCINVTPLLPFLYVLVGPSYLI